MALNNEIEKVCRQWSTEYVLLRKLQISLDGLCEGLYELYPETQLSFLIRYDQLQLKLHMETHGAEFSEAHYNGNLNSLNIAVTMLRNMFDSVRIKLVSGSIMIDMDADI